MRKSLLLALAIPFILLSGCAEMNSLMQSLPSDAPLSSSEVADGLKEALIKGSTKASSALSSENGYFGNELVKIYLPEEASIIIDNLSKIPGGEKLANDLILSINRAAEDAARDAAPIFINSIKAMSINDAFGILNGADNAATQYLIRTSRQDLYNLYQPKIRESTEKEIIGGVSTRESWDALTEKWNLFANSIAGKMAGFKPVNTELDDYLTNRALDGMFLKIEDEEKNIRQNISARTSSLLKKVFGSVDN